MGKYMAKFGGRIMKDFKQKELLPLKVLFFVHMSTLLVLYPYLTIHMRELGINIEETAIMSAVTPVIGILMPPLAGLLADKIGNFRLMLALFSVFSGLSALLLLLVPIGRITLTYPNDVVLGLNCDSNPALSLSNEFPCDWINNNTQKVDLAIQSCGYICNAYLDPDDDESVFRSMHYDITMFDLVANKSKSLRYTTNSTDYFDPTANDPLTNHKKLTNNEHYTTAIRKLSQNGYYFPTPALFNFYCEDQEDGYSCLLGNKNQLEKIKSFNNIKARVDLRNESNDDIIENKRVYDIIHLGDDTLSNVSCATGDKGEYVSVQLALMDRNGSVYKNLEMGSCATKCLATSDRSNFCSNKNTVVEVDVNVTFWSYLAVRVFIGIIGGTAYTMFEGAVIAILREYKADYGLQRMYASLGGMISSPLAGLLIDYASQGKGYTDYRPVFFLYAALKIISAALMMLINLEFKTPATSVVADVMSVMNIELISLFVAAFLLGSSWGYIENYLFWLLQDLGGTKSLMGLTITVGGILGIPLLALSGPLIKKIGHANIIFIGFLTYAVRLFGYSIIYNPWLSLIFEALECLTHSLCFTAAVTYAARLSSVTTDTTIQGILGGLFYGVGKSAGSLVGGYLIKYYGMRGTFQIFAAVSAFTAFVYLAFFHIYMKKRSGLVNQQDAFKDYSKKEKEINAIEKMSVPYEVSLTNLGFEETETKSTDDKAKTEVSKESV
ncbi:PREDICTED: uncharacterized protein LOC108567096 [Nicrophorus vespilloides]|uniref:Uncharacterized protein LOC108567096 n=1 Tax=Nicrophorus vespilloides TaxID=110193 RepID=A0ABM1N7P5_NICVS|nr:PREDICTED: uncharacterized protein LOC108567096 [Nicrophorus vespilloides]